MKELRGSNTNKETVTPLKKNQVETGQTGRVMSVGKNKGCILMNLRKNKCVVMNVAEGKSFSYIEHSQNTSEHAGSSNTSS